MTNKNNGGLVIPSVDALAQFIRTIDGEHDTGADILAERICEWLKAAPAPAVPKGWMRGNLLTLTQDSYPALGEWFGQIWDGDNVVARVYGSSHAEVNHRMDMLLAAAPQPEDKGDQP